MQVPALPLTSEHLTLQAASEASYTQLYCVSQTVFWPQAYWTPSVVEAWAHISERTSYNPIIWSGVRLFETAVFMYEEHISERSQMQYVSRNLYLSKI